jgi:YbgC/YbaW family acyl-CoA thioester hydrolase
MCALTLPTPNFDAGSSRSNLKDDKWKSNVMTDLIALKPQLENFRFSQRLRVRWAEVDMQKIVFNAHYLTYFDTAIADYWRTLALPYEETMQALGGELHMKKSSLEHHASARFDDLLDVALQCQAMGPSSIVFRGAIFHGDELLVTSELLYVFADPITQRTRPVPEVLRQILLNFEDGQAVLTLKTGHWVDLGWDAMEIRIEVFVDEQLIPLELENDADDDAAFHAVAYNGIGQVVATGRLLKGQQGQGRIGRMAVKRVLRGSGQGAAVLASLQAEATRRGDKELALHAQTSAQGFYERLGFKARGDVFDEVGLSHIEMFLEL